MPFGVFFCGDLQALEGLLGQGRDFFPSKPKCPVQAAGQGAGEGTGPQQQNRGPYGPLRRLQRGGTGGSKAQKEGGGPAPKGGPPPV